MDDKSVSEYNSCHKSFLTIWLTIWVYCSSLPIFTFCLFFYRCYLIKEQSGCAAVTILVFRFSKTVLGAAVALVCSPVMAQTAAGADDSQPCQEDVRLGTIVIVGRAASLALVSVE
jgi:hypothetical protein